MKGIVAVTRFLCGVVDEKKVASNVGEEVSQMRCHGAATIQNNQGSFMAAYKREHYLHIRRCCRCITDEGRK
jgi:hypothetical protein